MAIKNSIPLKGNDDPRSVAIRAKTKGSSSVKRKLSQQIRRMREFPKGHDPKIVELISNPEASATQIQELLQIALKKRLKPNDFINLINTVIKKHQAIFGNKIDFSGNLRIDSRVENAQIEVHKEQMIRHKLLDFVGEELEKKFGYLKMVEIQRIIYSCLEKLKNMKVEQIEAFNAKIFIIGMNLRKQNNYDLDKSFEQAVKEVKEEVKK